MIEKRVIPNLLSASRLVLTPIILFTLIYQLNWIALLLLGLAGLTDLADGYLARSWKSQTRLGLLIDPIGDKFLVLSLLCYLFLLGEIPWWYFSTVFLRDLSQGIGMMVLKLFGKPWLAPANIFGKMATASNIVAIIFTIASHELISIERYLSYLFIVASAVTLLSFCSYSLVWYALFTGRSTSAA